MDKNSAELDAGQETRTGEYSIFNLLISVGKILVQYVLEGHAVLCVGNEDSVELIDTLKRFADYLTFWPPAETFRQKSNPHPRPVRR